MASKQTINIVIYAVIGLFAAASLYIMFGKHGGGNNGPALYISGPPRTAQPLGNYTKYFQPKTHPVEGGTAALTYYLLAPQGAPYPKGLTFPLVVVLHGATGVGHAGQYIAAPKMQTVYPTFVVAPVLPRGMKWDMPDAWPDVQGYAPLSEKQKGMPYVAGLVKSLEKQQPAIDPKRVYVIGCSEGGSGVLSAAMKYSDVFAAGIDIGGDWNPTDGSKMAGMPLWIIQGAQDADTLATTRRLQDYMKGAGGSPAYTEIADMADQCDSPRLYTDATWNWLFSKHK